ncbi:hypothetical protein Hanom_Chr13g01228811 [Helianthus anomalus]
MITIFQKQFISVYIIHLYQHKSIFDAEASFSVCSVLTRRLIFIRIRSIFTYGQNHVNN